VYSGPFLACLFCFNSFFGNFQGGRTKKSEKKWDFFVFWKKKEKKVTSRHDSRQTGKLPV